jgi:tRNA threonylcarbamoyladenosine biosynthesis protein TsaE
MKKEQIKTSSVGETIRLAEKLALLLNPGDVITLEGDLGSGKTALRKELQMGLV